MFSGLRHKSFIFKLDVLVLLLCISGVYQSAQKADLALPLQEQAGQIRVRAIHPGLGLQNLQAQDRLMAINGRKVFSLEDIEFITDGMSIGDSVTTTFRRNDFEWTQSLCLKPANSIIYLIILSLAGFIFFSLGVFVLKNRPDGDAVALVFHWLSVLIAVHICTTFGHYSATYLLAGYVPRLVFLLASSLTPVLLVHFSFLFPKEKGTVYRFYIKICYGLTLLFFTFLSTLFWQAADRSSIPDFHRFMFAYNVGRWLFALFFIFAVVNFLHSYYKASEESERRKLRWVILGLAIGPLSFVLFWQIPQILVQKPLVPEELMLLITTLAPVTFAISIMRYHILDIDYIFNRSTVYVIVLSVLLLLYAAMVGVAALVVQMFTVQISLLISAVATVVVAVLFEPLRKTIQKMVDKRFFRVRYDYRQAQTEFSKAINLFVDIQSLADFIVSKLNDLLQPKRLALFYIDANKEEWQLAAHKNLHTIDEEGRKEIIQFSESTLTPLLAVRRFMEPGIPFESANPDIFKQNHIILVLPIRLQNAQNAGFLILGKKKSAALYSHEDIDLLKTAVLQIALAIERIRLQQELIIQHAETRRLDELNRLKSYFVSGVSHDLQTPLTSIRMFAELLQNKKKISVKEQHEYLEIIQGESERLSRLIRNVLDFPRVEQGIKTYHMQRIDPGEVIQSVMRSMSYQLQQQQFETVIQIPKKKISIKADADAVTEVLDNLISNALKYSSEQKFIRISLSAVNAFARIEVEDKGIGIAPEEQTHIFEAFYRSGKAREHNGGGTGLGLSLVRHIMEAHGGKIELDSQPGKGSTFTLYFPVV